MLFIFLKKNKRVGAVRITVWIVSVGAPRARLGYLHFVGRVMRAGSRTQNTVAIGTVQL